jgi:PRTRC genetic system protein A
MFANLVTYAIHSGLAGGALPAYDAIAYQYILAANGVFIRAETHFWQVLMPLARCQVRGLSPLRPHFQLKVARLPQSLLTQVVADARRTQGRGGELNEVLYWFHHVGDHIRVTRPAQKINASSVRHAGAAPTDVILELHSHGHYTASWSGVDNRDEQGALIYGIIGRLDGRPEIRLRLGLYGYHWPLPVTLLFDGAGGLADVTSRKE